MTNPLLVEWKPTLDELAYALHDALDRAEVLCLIQKLEENEADVEFSESVIKWAKALEQELLEEEAVTDNRNPEHPDWDDTRTCADCGTVLDHDDPDYLCYDCRVRDDAVQATCHYEEEYRARWGDWDDC